MASYKYVGKHRMIVEIGWYPTVSNDRAVSVLWSFYTLKQNVLFISLFIFLFPFTSTHLKNKCLVYTFSLYFFLVISS